jgi:hypothetical protein
MSPKKSLIRKQSFDLFFHNRIELQQTLHYRHKYQQFGLPGLSKNLVICSLHQPNRGRLHLELIVILIKKQSDVLGSARSFLDPLPCIIGAA